MSKQFPDFHQDLTMDFPWISRGTQGCDLHSEDGCAQGLHQQCGNLRCHELNVDFSIDDSTIFNIRTGLTS
jgi:hypothetical protein